MTGDSKKVLVTGGAGFIGSSLVRKLLSRDTEVIVYDSFFTGKKEFLPLEKENLHIVQGTLLDVDKLKKSFMDYRPSVVYHLAALHYIPYCNANPVETVMVNVGGTESVLAACRDVNIEKFVFASTAAVYAINEYSNSEKDDVLPLDIYGATKYFGEHLVRLFNASCGVPCVVARLFNVYGPNETNDHVIPAILKQLVKSHRIRLGNLEPKRDYIFVEDVARALTLLSEESNTAVEIFNVGSGCEYSVTDLVKVIRELTEIDIQVEQEGSRTRKSDRLHLLADISKIDQITGWRPKFGLIEGLEALIRAEYRKLIEGAKNVAV